MTKSHGRKSRARDRSCRSGVAYAAANAGSLHVHASGPSATDLQPDPGRWGVETVPDLRTAAALIGASIERCAPCRQSLTAKLLEEDPIVLAVTAGAACRLHAYPKKKALSPGPPRRSRSSLSTPALTVAMPDCCSRESSGCPQRTVRRSWATRWTASVPPLAHMGAGVRRPSPSRRMSAA
ncbi:hypothetical protein [Streptomyces sp. NPDC058086]|uniref:hypothetical protein n=1 Tax=Streptomyces sp. NPDC058086 TaxID=3346334 RepID=UPI0036E0D278